MNNSERRQTHEEAKRTRKLKKLCQKLDISLLEAQSGLIKAKLETYTALARNEALMAYRERN